MLSENLPTNIVQYSHCLHLSLTASAVRLTNVSFITTNITYYKLHPYQNKVQQSIKQLHILQHHLLQLLPEVSENKQEVTSHELVMPAQAYTSEAVQGTQQVLAEMQHDPLASAGIGHSGEKHC